MLTVLMTSVTKGAHSVNEIVDKVRTSSLQRVFFYTLDRPGQQFSASEHSKAHGPA